MNNLIWIGIVLIAWTRPIDIHYTYTERVNGRIVKQRDYVRILAWVIAIALIVWGILA
jgi:threonine/homoserine/homoserine lactone efflux protein